MQLKGTLLRELGKQLDIQLLSGFLAIYAIEILY